MKVRSKTNGRFVGNKKTNISCRWCGEVFIDYASQTRGFCSRKCALSHNKPVPPSQLGKTWKLSEVTKKNQSKAQRKRASLMTNEEKEIHRQKVIMALAGEDVRKRMSLSSRGEKSPNWLGGRTKVTKKIRKGYKYAWWRGLCFQRDNYTCVLCFIRGGRLEVDHFPKTFASILNTNKISTLEEAEGCEELWDISNGRTLCVPCHKKATYTK